VRIAVAGSGRLAAGALARLLNSTHEIAAVVESGRRSGIERKADALLSAALSPGATPGGMALRRGIPIVYLDRMDAEELAPLARTEPDLLLVAGFGVILKRPVLDLLRIGCVNCHSSLLPRHRGPNPFQAVILAGERQSGVTFHIMTEGIDDGDIVAQYAFDLDEDDTAGAVYAKSAEVLHARVVEVMDQIEREGLHGTPQRPEDATYDRRLEGDDLLFRWSRPARALERLVRACRPFDTPGFTHRGRIVFVLRATCADEAVDAPPGTVVESVPRVVIAAGQGALRIEQAFTRSPLPWIWPPFLGRPRPGDRIG